MNENKDSTIILRPVAYYNDPFHEENAYLVLCDCYYYKEGSYEETIPAFSNSRYFAKRIMDAC